MNKSKRRMQEIETYFLFIYTNVIEEQHQGIPQSLIR